MCQVILKWNSPRAKSADMQQGYVEQLGQISPEVLEMAGASVVVMFVEGRYINLGKDLIILQWLRRLGVDSQLQV